MRNKVLAALVVCCVILVASVIVVSAATLTATYGGLNVDNNDLALVSSPTADGIGELPDGNTLVRVRATGLTGGDHTILVLPANTEASSATIQFIDQRDAGDFRFRLRNAAPGAAFRVMVGGVGITEPLYGYFRIYEEDDVSDGPVLRQTSDALVGAPGWTGTGFMHFSGTNAFDPFPGAWLLGEGNGYARISIALDPSEHELEDGYVWRGVYRDGEYVVDLLWSPERHRFDALIRGGAAMDFEDILDNIDWYRVQPENRREIVYGVRISYFGTATWPTSDIPLMGDAMDMFGIFGSGRAYDGCLTKGMHDLLKIGFEDGNNVTMGAAMLVFDRFGGTPFAVVSLCSD